MDVCVKCGRQIEKESEATLRVDKDRCVCCNCWVNNDRAVLYRYIINYSLGK